MNSDKPKSPQGPTKSPVEKEAPKDERAKLSIKGLINQLGGILKRGAKHASFIGIMLVLLAYLFVVWQINNLATAEPSADAAASAETKIPKVDPKAINQIQALEQGNTSVHSLFNQARNNPFHE